MPVHAASYLNPQAAAQSLSDLTVRHAVLEGLGMSDDAMLLPHALHDPLLTHVWQYAMKTI